MVPSARDGATLRGNDRPAKNVILFVGDGMGVSTVSARASSTAS
jgi:alkaline phosphatase